ncbi:MAG TPA: hypothetical protein PK595_01075 [Bacteroidota bacterium]|nr:hypothetical protein [Bacteroidota bacterium]
MRHCSRILIITTIFTAAFVVTVQAQDLQEQIQKLSRDAVIGYVSPFLNHFSADLNSGYYHSADLHKVLGFDIGVKVSLTFVKDGDKTFIYNLPETFTVRANEIDPSYPSVPITFRRGVDYPETITLNTALGSKESTPLMVSRNFKFGIGNGDSITIPVNKQIFSFPGGFDIPSVPLPVPQVAIGLPLGFEVIGRYIPPTKIEDAGKLSYFGFGLRYDVDQWIPLCPVDIAVHFTTQKLTFKSTSDKDIFTAKGVAYGLEASKSILFVTLYGGFQLEKATATLNDYDYLDPATGNTVTVKGFDFTGDNKSRFNVGLRFSLFILDINAEYSFAKVPVATLGAGISIR